MPRWPQSKTTNEVDPHTTPSEQLANMAQTYTHGTTTELLRGAGCAVRVARCVVRGARCAVRGAWCAVRGA
eukprot:9955457-Alexandrium_andersonii.AAC.1